MAHNCSNVKVVRICIGRTPTHHEVVADLQVEGRIARVYCTEYDTHGDVWAVHRKVSEYRNKLCGAAFDLIQQVDDNCINLNRMDRRYRSQLISLLGVM